MPTSVCQWINSFLTDRQQIVKLGKYTPNTRTISTGAPQGCAISSLLSPCREELPVLPLCSPPLTIMNSTVTAVESFRFLGTTISQDLKWDNHIDSIVKKGPAEAVLPSPAEELQELIQPATGAAETVTLCHY